MSTARRLRWGVATTLGLVLAGFAFHFPGSFDSDTWRIDAMAFGGVLGMVSGVVTGALQWASVRPSRQGWRFILAMAIGIGVSHALADGAPTSIGTPAVAVASAGALTAAMALVLSERRPLTLAASLAGWAGGWIVAYAVTVALELPRGADPTSWAIQHAVVGLVVGIIWSGLITLSELRSPAVSAERRAVPR